MALIVKPRSVGYFGAYVNRRIQRNKNFLACITGQTGSGKSYAALKLAEELDPNFSIRNVVFEAEEFMQLINSGSLVRGSHIIWDEAGVGQNARAWQSLSNRLINYVMQTFRHKNYVVWFTSPDFSFVDAATRKLFHSVIETVGINKSDSTCSLKPLLIQVNQRSGNVYMKYLRVKSTDGIAPFKRLRVSLASSKLIQDYEQKKTDYTSKLNSRIEEELKTAREKKEKKFKDLTPKQEEILSYLESGLTVKSISECLDISEKGVYGHVHALKQKGIKVSPIKEGQKVIRFDIVRNVSN